MKEILYPALVTIISAVITTVVLPALASWLKSMTQNQKLQAAIDDLIITAGSSVNYVEQTMVADFKKSGTWNAETQNAALDEAITQMVNGLTQQTLEYLKANQSDVEVIANRYIQSYIQSQKDIKG